MSRSISQDITDALEENKITYFYLIEFTIGDSTYRYTNCEVPIICAPDGTNSYTFTPRGLDFDSISYSNDNIVDSCSIRLDNLDSVLTALFVDNVIAEETATLYVIFYDDNNTIIEMTQIFNGYINEFMISEQECDLTLTAEFAKWSQKTASKHSSLCRWKVFKGSRCSYSGEETSCDRTYTRCAALENTDNFGGFRWLPKIEDQTIWWGQKPKYK